MDPPRWYPLYRLYALLKFNGIERTHTYYRDPGIARAILIQLLINSTRRQHATSRRCDDT